MVELQKKLPVYLKVMARKRKEVAIYKSKSRKRKGIHAKSKMSKLKGSKNYCKKYNGQGK